MQIVRFKGSKACAREQIAKNALEDLLSGAFFIQYAFVALRQERLLVFRKIRKLKRVDP